MTRLLYAGQAGFVRPFCMQSALETLMQRVARSAAARYDGPTSPFWNSVTATIAELDSLVKSEFEVLEDSPGEPLWQVATRVTAFAPEDMALHTVFVLTAEPEKGPASDTNGARYSAGVVYAHASPFLDEDGFLDYFETRKIWPLALPVAGRRSWLGEWPSLADPNQLMIDQLLSSFSNGTSKKIREDSDDEDRGPVNT